MANFLQTDYRLGVPVSPLNDVAGNVCVSETFAFAMCCIEFLSLRFLSLRFNAETKKLNADFIQKVSFSGSHWWWPTNTLKNIYSTWVICHTGFRLVARIGNCVNQRQNKNFIFFIFTIWGCFSWKLHEVKSLAYI